MGVSLFPILPNSGRKLIRMASNLGGADHAELRAGVLTLLLEQSEPWPESDPTSELMPRIVRCLAAIESGEAQRFAPEAKSFRITVIYHDDPPGEVTRALERVRLEQQGRAEVVWHPDRPG